MLRCVKGLSSGVETRVVMDVAKSRWFGVQRNLRQGYLLSPQYLCGGNGGGIGRSSSRG